MVHDIDPHPQGLQEEPEVAVCRADVRDKVAGSQPNMVHAIGILTHVPRWYFRH